MNNIDLATSVVLTLKDVLTLIASLILPLAIGIFTIISTNNQQKEVMRQNERDLLLREQERNADKQNELQRQLALDKYRDELLVAFIKEIGDLLKENNGSLTSSPIIATIARSKTLATIRQLDARRSSDVIRFLYEAGQLTNSNQTMALDISGVELFNISKNVFKIVTKVGKLSLMGIYLHNCMLNSTSLHNIDFSSAELDHMNFSVAKLHDVAISSAILSNVEYTSATLQDVNFSSSQLNAVYFSSAHLGHAHHSCVRISGVDNSFPWPISIDFPFENPQDDNFLSAQFDNVNFSSARLYSASFRSSKFYNVDFSFTKINNIDFSDVHLENVNFSFAELNYVNFRSARLVNVNFSSAIFRTVDFSGSEFSSVHFAFAVLGIRNVVVALFY